MNVGHKKTIWANSFRQINKRFYLPLLANYFRASWNETKGRLSVDEAKEERTSHPFITYAPKQLLRRWISKDGAIKHALNAQYKADATRKTPR